MAVRAIATGSETGTTARIPETSSRPSVIIERACVGVLSPCPRRPCVSALASPRRVAVVLRRARHSWRGAAAVRGEVLPGAALFVGGGRPSCCVADCVGCCVLPPRRCRGCCVLLPSTGMCQCRRFACKIWNAHRQMLANGAPCEFLVIPCASARTGACARRGRMNLACRHTLAFDRLISMGPRGRRGRLGPPRTQ